MSKRRSYKKPEEYIKIAMERIEILFRQAQMEFPKHPELSDRYVELARQISMKFNIPIRKELKRKFCKKCYKYLVVGKNARVRLFSEKKYKIMTCLECGNKMRVSYSKKNI